MYMCNTENNIAKPLKAIFYKRQVGNTSAKRKRDETEKVFDALSSYHQNVKLTVQENPTKFLDTKITRENCEKKNIKSL